MSRVQIVLVRPENPANVGAVARSIRNAGLAGLRLVAPGDWRSVECWRTAWGAQDVLEQAQVHASLAEALADARFSVAFSGRRGAALDAREVGAALAELAPDDGACLVFGPESAGLTNEEIALCGRRARIPAHAGQPSLNLSHAVAIAAYEVFRAQARPASPLVRASHADKERLLGLLREGLLAVAALPEANTDGYFEEWRAFVQGLDLLPQQLRLLEHMARNMVRHGRGRPRGTRRG